MNIDDRLDRLTERHEALTQSVELLAHQSQTIMEAIGKLVQVAESHERRLDHFERGQ
jgi:hypothetical protein